MLWEGALENHNLWFCVVFCLTAHVILNTSARPHRKYLDTPVVIITYAPGKIQMNWTLRQPAHAHYSAENREIKLNNGGLLPLQNQCRGFRTHFFLLFWIKRISGKSLLEICWSVIRPICLTWSLEVKVKLGERLGNNQSGCLKQRHNCYCHQPSDLDSI